jgi:hypothetical protein
MAAYLTVEKALISCGHLSAVRGYSPILHSQGIKCMNEVFQTGKSLFAQRAIGLTLFRIDEKWNVLSPQSGGFPGGKRICTSYLGPARAKYQFTPPSDRVTGSSPPGIDYLPPGRLGCPGEILRRPGKRFAFRATPVIITACDHLRSIGRHDATEQFI